MTMKHKKVLYSLKHLHIALQRQISRQEAKRYRAEKHHQLLPKAAA